MEDIKRQEIKSVIIAEWDKYPTTIDLARDIEEGFILGKYAKSEHYSLTEIMDIVLEVEAEKNFVVVEEEIPDISEDKFDEAMEAAFYDHNPRPIIEEVPTEIIEPEIPFEEDGN